MNHSKSYLALRQSGAVIAVCGAIFLAGCAAPDYQTAPPGYPYPDAQAQPGQPMAQPDYRRRPNETLYEANVTSMRAVVAPGPQRCWIEREPVAQPRHNVPGAIAGGLIGGILGHQIGRGTGRDIATVGGAVAGAAVGSTVGRNNAPQTQDVQRCTTDTSAATEYWEVTYNFRGTTHYVQMTTPPGRTILVNGNGEPRI
ncbi:MAG: glycine zipper 2TM domain-containing protein [Hydrogenophaga sp.]|nr:glycine zipper 2TM domain-containing protein [Hydrogenophaga sp.]